MVETAVGRRKRGRLIDEMVWFRAWYICGPTVLVQYIHFSLSLSLAAPFLA